MAHQKAGTYFLERGFASSGFKVGFQGSIPEEASKEIITPAKLGVLWLEWQGARPTPCVCLLVCWFVCLFVCLFVCSVACLLKGNDCHSCFVRGKLRMDLEFPQTWLPLVNSKGGLEWFRGPVFEPLEV